MSAPRWTWVLASSTGSALADLTTVASGCQIRYQRNAPVEAQFSLSHHDEAAVSLLEYLSTGNIPTLRCYRQPPSSPASPADLAFNGYLAPFQESLEEAATITAVFRSPFARLLGESSARGRFTSEFVNYATQDAGQIAKSLIDTTNSVDGPSGLTTAGGTFQTTKNRNRSYQYANVGEEIVNLTQIRDGFDFYETFVEGDTTLAIFNVAASLGSDKSSWAKFQYGTDTLANVRAVNRSTEPPVNRVRVLGGNGLTSVKELSASIAQSGVWYMQANATDVIDQPVLDDMASALLRPKPVRTVEFTPEYGLESCPRPFDDFWLGDHVSFFGRRGAFFENITVRVNGFSIVIDDNGYEAAEIQDPTTPEGEASLRATMTVEAT